MIELEIDGQKVEVPPGSMVMEAATKLGLYVPHFCYHKKLSIAANCRMCLVEVEKAPKPLPACATPVTAGMKVYTASEKAKLAQKGVMEFLLINHPLDCPICDQGGECQLQDLAVGYGPSASRYTEEKRVVFHKPMGPLISAEEMSRCIHCTRCVRFGQEIAGVMELGMAGRGEHSEIMSFVGNAVESELSGNMIDICPVGALTSKPFRYSARTWELSRRRSVSPHDSLGANLVVQSKSGTVMRVVPQENDAVNECWISDRDRFSYEGLNVADRLTVPMIREATGQWREADWQEALARAADMLKQAASRGANRVRGLASPISTLEELSLMAQVVRGLGSDAVDCRLGLSDPDFDAARVGVPGLGLSLAELSEAERVFVVGSQLRAEVPLVAQRLRQAVRRGAQVSVLNAWTESLLMPVHTTVSLAPLQWDSFLQTLQSLTPKTKSKVTPAEVVLTQAQAVWESLSSAPSEGGKTVILAGAGLLNHPQAGLLLSRLQQIASTLGARLGVLPKGGNGLGGYLAHAVPSKGGLNAAQMFDAPIAAYVLVNVEPALDLAVSPRAVKTMKDSLGVVALTSYRSAVEDVASIMLPIAPFTETSGSFVNLEGRLQAVQAVVPPLGQSRPGWKVLRVLGNLLGLQNFDFTSSEEVRNQVLPGARDGEVLPGLGFQFGPVSGASAKSKELLDQAATAPLYRVSDTPIYLTDPIVRRAKSLLQTRQSQVPKAWFHPTDLPGLGLASGMQCAVKQGGAEALFEVGIDTTLAPGLVRIATGHPQAAALNITMGPLQVRPVTKAADAPAEMA
ncbi:MAG: dehydrogenase subunit [Pseudomonadota bacterium]